MLCVAVVAAAAAMNSIGENGKCVFECFCVLRRREDVVFCDSNPLLPPLSPYNISVLSFLLYFARTGVRACGLTCRPFRDKAELIIGH